MLADIFRPQMSGPTFSNAFAGLAQDSTPPQLRQAVEKTAPRLRHSSIKGLQKRPLQFKLGKKIVSIRFDMCDLDRSKNEASAF